MKIIRVGCPLFFFLKSLTTVFPLSLVKCKVPLLLACFFGELVQLHTAEPRSDQHSCAPSKQQTMISFPTNCQGLMNPFLFTFCAQAVNLQLNCLFRSSNKISKPMNQKGKLELECILHILSMEFEIPILFKGSIEAGFPRAVVLGFCVCVK